MCKSAWLGERWGGGGEEEITMYVEMTEERQQSDEKNYEKR